MITQVSKNMFIDCSALKDNFSYEARVSLFDYFEYLEAETGETIEFDPIAIRCDFSEYSSINEAFDAYCLDSPNDDLGFADMIDYKLSKLRDMTQVIELDNGGIILQDY